MDMYETFESIINEAIQANDLDEYDIWSESYGWDITDRNTGEHLEVRLETY